MLLSRRSVAGGLVAGLSGAGMLTETAQTAEAAQRSSDPGSDGEIARAIRDLTDLLKEQRDRDRPPSLLFRIREVQRLFLRSTQKYPDYIEVGLGVWDQLYDWHVHTRQVLPITNLANGRYAITTLLSTFVLRIDAADDYIGPGNDTLQ